MATVATLKSIFAAFADVADATVQYWLDRALLVTGDWADDHASYLLACHYMTLNGFGTGTAAQLAAQGLAGVKSLKSGTLTVDFGDAASAKAKGDFNGTSYGQQFYPLLLAHVAGALITPTGTVCGYPGRRPWVS